MKVRFERAADMTTDKAREAARREFMRTEINCMSGPLNFKAGWDAGVAEGIRQAREAAANVDPVESALQGSDAAVQAIDALKPN